MALRKLTLEEVDLILQAATAKQLHAEIHLPEPGNILFKNRQTHLTLGHLSDKRDGTHVRNSEHNATLTQDFYPTAVSKNPLAIASTVLTAGAPAADVSRPGNLTYENEIQCIYVVSNAFGANRGIAINLHDGVATIPIFDSGIFWPTGVSFLVWPVDVSTFMTGAISVIGVPPLRTNNTTYLNAVATGLAGAETFTIYITPTSLPIGTGLRQ